MNKLDLAKNSYQEENEEQKLVKTWLKVLELNVDKKIEGHIIIVKALNRIFDKKLIKHKLEKIKYWKEMNFNKGKWKSSRIFLGK